MMNRRQMQRASLALAGRGQVVRTRGTSDAPLWWFRSRAQADQGSEDWADLMARRDWARGERLIVAVLNPAIGQLIEAGALRYGMQTLVPDAADLLEAMAEVPARYVVTSPLAAFRMLLQGMLDGVEELWLTGDVTGQGALEQRIREFAPDTIVRNVYAVTEHPGPVAVSCAAGRWHFLEDQLDVELVHPRTGARAEPGQPASVRLTRHWDDALSLDRYDVLDLVTALEHPCPCGDGGSMTSTTPWGRLTDLRAIQGGWISPSHLAQAWFRTEGLSDRLKASLVWDDAAECEMLQVRCAVLHGYDPDRTVARLKELLQRTTRVAVAVEAVKPANLWPDVSCHIEEGRDNPADARDMLD